MQWLTSSEFLGWAGPLVLLLAAVAYCGSKLCSRPNLPLQATAHIAVFAATLVFGLLLFAWVDGNLPELEAFARRCTRPMRSFAADFLDFF